jgi:hypothetical protein
MKAAFKKKLIILISLTSLEKDSSGFRYCNSGGYYIPLFLVICNFWEKRIYSYLGIAFFFFLVQ